MKASILVFICSLSTYAFAQVEILANESKPILVLESRINGDQTVCKITPTSVEIHKTIGEINIVSTKPIGISVGNIIRLGDSLVPPELSAQIDNSDGSDYLAIGVLSSRDKMILVKREGKGAIELNSIAAKQLLKIVAELCR